jgi:hypothetical protein
MVNEDEKTQLLAVQRLTCQGKMHAIFGADANVRAIFDEKGE